MMLEGVAMMTYAINEDHPILSAILGVRRKAASNFSPEFSGSRGEAYDKAVLDCYKAVELALRAETTS